jgi:hypothetical protein
VNDESELGWRIISGEELLVMLRSVESGDRPQTVFEEFWADSQPLWYSPLGEAHEG